MNNYIINIILIITKWWLILSIISAIFFGIFIVYKYQQIEKIEGGKE